MNRREFMQDLGALIAGLVVAPSLAEAAASRLPDLGLYTESGQATRLSAYYGKPRLFSCWGAFCSPCIEEIPEVNKLTSSISVVGLYWMKNYTVAEDRASLEKIKASHPMSFQNLFVPQDAQGQLKRFGVMTVPTFFVVDASGTLR